ncbi:MAG: acetylornithine deacetylase/succinyl-diaminopimelate desuccinylase family protein [Gemmatimonadetes bacterium]|nr:acetylornithine deacetylase/succinyl-diaminopimelate desuccinylase family protein [Gemmatimonadota bacterium]MYG85105.1 acetylornithine deacetylase/succinyl-diaminopimelate desuccinylase family protein [Gemmatimonadota bacterium]MYJ89317.1 acetylornithine deacetylase/succinyl-diaminopimelate desuccinylase family protein [Gemmatimonadota bacterium]
MITPLEQRIVEQVRVLRDDMIGFLRALIQIPSVNPPGDGYPDCARLVGDRLRALGFETRYVTAAGHPDHSEEHPRVNVVGRLSGRSPMPTLHFNGHTDVVPPGEHWTVDPFGGEVKDGRIYGRGACDMKGGIAAALFAAAAVREAGVSLRGSLEFSATVDEETGGFAGMDYLAREGLISPERTSYVIIPEPFGPGRICLGHRGVYWFRVDTIGRTAHGSMPFLGVSAINKMERFLSRVSSDLAPALRARKTEMPVDPPEARRATINVNGITGGQTDGSVGSPCVADRCSAIFDRRFLIEESFDDVKKEIETLIAHLTAEDRDFKAELTDLMVVRPVETDPDAELVGTASRTIEDLTGVPAEHVASPGTYDHKHVHNTGRVKQCIAYGPGLLHLAHQPDEYCEIEHLVRSCEVMAVTAARLLGVN